METQEKFTNPKDYENVTETEAIENSTLVAQEGEILPAEIPVAKKKSGKRLFLLIGICAVAVIAIVAFILIRPSMLYNKATKCLENDDYFNAIKYYEKVIDHKDTEKKIQKAYIGAAKSLVVEKKYEDALEMLEDVTNTDKCKDVYLLAGEQLVIDKDYEQAVSMLELVGDDEMCQVVYLTAGQQMVDDKQYSEAIEMLKKASGTEVPDLIKYCESAVALNDQQFDTAITGFKNLGDFKDSAELLNQSYYGKAEKLYNEKNYADAKEIYEKTTGYDDVESKILNCTFMEAEAYYKDGDLAKAQELFSTFSPDFAFDGVSAKTRLETLKNRADLVKLCGTWEGRGGNMSVRQTHDSTGLWDQWDAEFTDRIQIKCVINDDGTVTIKGTAKYYTYTNYSSLSKYLKTLELSATFEKTGSQIPNELYSSSIATLTYDGSKFILKYKLVDSNSSMNFTYTYISNITYDTKK